MPGVRKFILFVLVALLTRQAWAQDANYTALLRRVSERQEQAFQKRQGVTFYERRQLDWGSETRAVIETRDGRLDRIVAFNNQPLAPDQTRKQEQRLRRLLNNPQALNQELSRQLQEVKRRQAIAAALPEAFVLSFSREEPDGILRFDFTPNPAFAPKTKEARALKGMRGRLWIDCKSEMIVRAQGELFKDVSFGWGIVGRLHKGGRFEFVQEQVLPGIWRITFMNLDFKGRVFLSSLRVLLKEESSDFAVTPPEMDAARALTELLLDHSLPREPRRNQAPRAKDY